MADEQKEFSKKINTDKAKNKTKIAIILIIISISTYILPLMYGDFDFGLIFEVISLIFLIIARNYMTKYDTTRSKRYIICAMISVGCLLIFDLIIFLLPVRNIGDLAFVGFGFYFLEILLISYMGLLFSINKDLAKADNPIKYKESTDWFYEKYEGKDDKDKNNFHN